jgi:hypothetical protein
MPFVAYGNDRWLGAGGKMPSARYPLDLSSAAQRHWRAAKCLAAKKDWDSAGYLAGFAAECRLKRALMRSGFRPTVGLDRRDDPFWAHFPNLKALMLQNGAAARISAGVVNLVASGGFMNEWDTVMRYAKTGSVNEATAKRWFSHVEQ